MSRPLHDCENDGWNHSIFRDTRQKIINLLPYLPQNPNPATQSLDVITIEVPVQNGQKKDISLPVALVINKADGKVVLSCPKPDTGLNKKPQRALDKLYEIVEYLVAKEIRKKNGVEAFESLFEEASKNHTEAVASKEAPK